MSDAIQNFRLKIRNSRKLKRDMLSFSLKEGAELEQAIVDLEKKIEQLERELMKEKTLSIDIVGAEF